MPPIVIGALAAAAGAIFTAGSIGAVTFLGLSGLEAVLARVAVSLVISGLTTLLSPKPKSPSLSFSSRAASRSQIVNQPTVPREVVYGEVLKSGSVAYLTSTDSNHKLHLMLVLADHEVQAINEVWLGDDVIPNDWLDADGTVNTGKYAGKVRIRKHLGTDGQTADSVAVAEIPSWTDQHRGRNVAYLFITFTGDNTLYPNGMPNPAAVVQGKKIYDSRTAAEAWTPNIGLITYHYLSDDRFGIGAEEENINEADKEAAANACEEMVDLNPLDTAVSSIDTGTDIITLSGSLLGLQRGDRVEWVTTGSAPGGLAISTDYFFIPYQFKGTPRGKLAATLADAIAGIAINITSGGTGTHTLRKTGEPRYFGGGVANSENTLGSNLQDILTGMGGRVTNIGGQWSLFAAVFRASSGTITQSELRGPLTIVAKSPMAEKYNRVQGVYVSPLNNWQPADYPLVKNDTFLANDNGVERLARIDFPYTQRGSTSQRLAGINLQLARQENVVQVPAKLHGLKYRCCDTIGLTHATMAWTDKEFEVQTFKVTFDRDQRTGAPILGADLVVKETAAACYEWDPDSEMVVDPAPNTDLPDPFTISQVVGLSVSSIPVDTRDGDRTYRAQASWEPITNLFVTTKGGKVHFQYRLTGATNWISLPPVPGSATSADIFSGQLGTGYDLRCWVENSLGLTNESDPVTLTGLSLGSPGGVGTTIDDGSVADAVGTTIDDGSVADAVGSTTDYGGVA